MKLLFVCTGNTCRSPLAEAAWQVVSREMDAELSAAGLGSISASSAGLAASSGDTAARNGITVARHWGVDLSRHSSRQLTATLLNQADLVLTMTRDQADTVAARFPQSKNKVRPLSTCASQTDLARLNSLWPEKSADAPYWGYTDIEDPYGGNLTEYEECAAQILACVRQLARDLMARQP